MTGTKANASFRSCGRAAPLLAAAALLLAWTPPARGAEYHVSPSGDDGGPGTEAQPWRTLAMAAVTAAAGDTVFIREGTYREMLAPENSGSEGSPITFTAFPGETAILDGEGVEIPYDPNWGGLVEINGRSWIVVSGLQVINSASAGIFLWNSCDNVVVENNHTVSTYTSGIGVWGCTNVSVRGNEVELAVTEGSNECISISGTDVFEVSGNHVHNGSGNERGGEGIDAKEGCSNGRIMGNVVEGLPKLGIYVDAWDRHTFNIEVFDNVSRGNTSGFALSAENGGLLENVRVYHNEAVDNEGTGFWVTGWGMPGVEHPLRGIELTANLSHRNGDGLCVVAVEPGTLLEDVTIANNLVYQNRLRGLRMDGPESAAGELLMRGVTIINNTFYANGEDWGGGIVLGDLTAENVVIRNNILSRNLSFQVVVGTTVDIAGLVVDFNLIDGFRASSNEIYGDDYVEGDPAFVDAAAADFHLLASSPAVDAASPEGAPAADFDGRARPWGEGYDMGAFEYALPSPDDPEPSDPAPDAADVSVDTAADAPDDRTAEDEGPGPGEGEGCGCEILR